MGVLECENKEIRMLVHFKFVVAQFCDPISIQGSMALKTAPNSNR